jgi:hypothetical protein
LIFNSATSALLGEQQISLSDANNSGGSVISWALYGRATTRSVLPGGVRLPQGPSCTGAGHATSREVGPHRTDVTGSR